MARPLGAGGNVAGAMAALAAATGYPRAVGCSGGFPRYGPEEFDAAHMIGEGGADAVLFVGGLAAGPLYKDDAGTPARRAAGGRQRGPIPTIVTGPRLSRGLAVPDIFLPTATPGLSAAGSSSRSDGVPVPLRAIVPSRRPTEDEALNALLERLG